MVKSSGGTFEDWENVGFVLVHELMCGVVLCCSQECFQFWFGFVRVFLHGRVHGELGINEWFEKLEWLSVAVERVEYSIMFFGWVETNSIMFSP